jgi:coatomer subunit beta'
MNIALQVEQMFLSQRDSTKAVGMPASDYLTAKDDLDLNLIELIKSQMSPQRAAEPAAPPGESKETDPDDVDPAPAATVAAEEEAARLAAEEARRAAEEAARLEEEARAEAEAAAAALAAAETVPAKDEDDFGDDW